MELNTTPKPRSRVSKFHKPSPSAKFQSPVLVARETPPEIKSLSFEELKKKTSELWKRNEDLKSEIVELRAKGYKEEQISWYMERLHEYNDVKDMAQMTFGRIAVLEETTVRNIHKEFGMGDDD